MLEKAIARSSKFVEAYWRLAELQALAGDTDKAVKTLRIAEQSNSDYTIETVIKLAELLFDNGLYQEAYDRITTVGNTSDRALRLKEKYLNAIHLTSRPIECDIKTITDHRFRYSCYFPNITADGRILSTTVSLPLEIFGNDTLYQEDLFCLRQLDGRWSVPAPLSNVINSEDNEGSQSFSSDGRYMFFVKCNCRDNVGSCDIYYSIRHGDSWSVPQNIGEPVNSRYWESNPSLAPSGDKMYFVSNRPGGEGDMDIWVADIAISDNGTLTSHNARPLGKPINTSKAESAPFIHADNKTLYFISNGHNGLGSNDIYLSQKTESGLWSEPTNLGYPINNHGNQLGITVSGDGNTGYYASDITPDGNKNRLSVYQFGMPSELQPQPMCSIVGTVTNGKTGKPMEAKVEIFDIADNSNCFKSVSDCTTGCFSAVLPIEGDYGIIAVQKGFMFNTTRVSHKTDTVSLILYPIEKGKKAILENIEFEYNSDKIIPATMSVISRLVDFMIQNPTIKVKVTGHTDNIGTGEYNKALSLRRAQTVINTMISQGIAPERVKSEGAGDTMPIADNTTEEGRRKNRRVEITIE